MITSVERGSAAKTGSRFAASSGTPTTRVLVSDALLVTEGEPLATLLAVTATTATAAAASATRPSLFCNIWSLPPIRLDNVAWCFARAGVRTGHLVDKPTAGSV